jgi:hypothetical protein
MQHGHTTVVGKPQDNTWGTGVDFYIILKWTIENKITKV